VKIALITDTHWGVRNDHIAFLDNSKKFLDEQFFPYLEEHEITTIIHLGDLVDRRKYININTAKRLREDFLEPIRDRGYNLHIICGNHDTYFKNTNGVNALNEIARAYKNTRIFIEPAVVEHNSLEILYLPWICDENRKQTMELIRSTSAQIAMGHLELAGFEMYRGSMVSHGDDVRIFDKFDMVMSGHYHHRSTNGHIFYLGSHAEFTWSDYDDPKGFHVFDTETRELTFIQNPYKMFDKLWYDDMDGTKKLDNIDISLYTGKIVKVIVTNKNDPYKFDLFIDKLQKVTLDLQIVEDHLNMNLEDDTEIVKEAESTIDIFKHHIDQLNIQNLDKPRLEKTIVDLYNEALTIE
jgi:DNA repair exonuclease SbcCD nuclease subunit